jgi:hypothetical protein
MPVAQILARHIAALQALHLHEPKTHETTGTIDGLGLHGIFHEWQDGDKQRRDQSLGLRTQSVLRVGNRLWIQNGTGEVRELRGLVARRQVTDDFIDTAQFASHPEDVSYIDRGTLPDGRSVYYLRIKPPKGETYQIAVDAKSFYIDQKSYIEGDAPATSTYDDYHVVDGMLLPYLEVDSSGDRRYDITTHVGNVTVNEPIAADTFAPLAPFTVSNTTPVTVPLIEREGLLFVDITMQGKPFRFLLDSGAQGVTFDPRVAKALNLKPQGSLEIRGAERVAAQGIVEAPEIHIAGATLPQRIASVIDLGSVVTATDIDGILGYPLFAAAELRLDPDAHTLTIAKPGTLAQVGAKIDLDTDRQLPEVTASAGSAQARFVIDTGNANEVLLYNSFLQAHPGVVTVAGHSFVANRGVGGSTAAVGTILDQLGIGPFHLYNLYANAILSTAGAFADRDGGGNIGYGVLRNFVATFDLANRALYLQKARKFDDGRYRNIGP